jgi:hypothetical protein
LVAGGAPVAVATRAPHFAQNLSSPSLTGLPQLEQDEPLDCAGAGPSLRPHPGQKGSEGSDITPQPGQARNTPPAGLEPAPRAFDALSTAEAGLPEAAPGTDACATGSPPFFMTAATLMTLAPPATTGLPQSMQNFDCSSLSRPQNPQRFTGAPRGRVKQSEYRCRKQVAASRIGA